MPISLSSPTTPSDRRCSAGPTARWRRTLSRVRWSAGLNGTNRNMKPKVVVLHNHDNSWTPEAQLEAERDRQTALEALRKFGYETTNVQVYDSVTEALRPRRLDPREWIVFNWCEGYADRPWDYDGVTEELDRLGYSYTGAATWSHRVSADKGRVQAVLREGGVSIPHGRVLCPAADLAWSIFPAIVKPLNQ